MKTLQQWYDAYGKSHQNNTNKKIHYICVPLIYFSIIGMLMAIPNTLLKKLFHTSDICINNWANPFLVLLFIFYFRLDKTTVIRMLLLSFVSLMINAFLSTTLPLFYFNLSLFGIAWAGQFYGHHLEGKKPSFFQDIQFLLIGPAWVMDNFFRPQK